MLVCSTTLRSRTSWLIGKGSAIQPVGRWLSCLALIFCECSAMADDGSSRNTRIPSPTVDHHQHLWSRAAYAITTRPSISPIALPPELKTLVDQRFSSGDVVAIKRAFTRHAVLLDGSSGEWFQGNESVAEPAKRLSRGRRFVALSLDLGQTGGSLAGTLVDGTGSETINRANVLLALRRVPGAEWHIAAETLTPQPPRVSAEEVSAGSLIAAMDAAGVRRAVVLSSGYWFANRTISAEEPEERGLVQTENDWAAEQVARYPDRLVAFCGINPLRSYAVSEVERCAANPAFRGIKLHFANSGIDVRDERHVEAVRRVFAAANRLRLAIVLHAWVPGGYGRRQSEILLDYLLPAAPDIIVQVAHLTGTGPGYFDSTDAALAVLADARRARDLRVANLYLDVASNVTAGQRPQTLATIANRLREIGLDHVLFGSDATATDPVAIRTEWSNFLRLPLNRSEFRRVAGNVAPYLRQPLRSVDDE